MATKTLTLDEFLALGSNDPNNRKAELYNFETRAWQRVEDHPFGHGPFLSTYDLLYIAEHRSFLVIAGYTNSGALTQIAKLKDGAWSDAGQLNTYRSVSFYSFFIKVVRVGISRLFNYEFKTP